MGREEAEANTASTVYDLRASEAASYIPGSRVVIVTTGLVWDQKGQTHSTLNRGFRQEDLEQAADIVSQKPLGSCWFRPEGVVSKSPFASMLQATYGDLSKVDLELPEGLHIGLGNAATTPIVHWTST